MKVVKFVPTLPPEELSKFPRSDAQTSQRNSSITLRAAQCFLPRLQISCPNFDQDPDIVINVPRARAL